MGSDTDIGSANTYDLEFCGVSKVYERKTVVNNIRLEVRPGEFLAVLGPSGSGKSTLLKMAAGFEPATEGKILLQGCDVTRVPPYLRNVNTVFQNYALFPHLSVFENVAYGLRRKSVPKAEISLRVNEALALVHLPSFSARFPHTLSGGEQQRVAVARALVNRPAVLLLDEPLSALDLKIRRNMQLELKRIHREVGTTFVYVTHDQEEALVMADRIAVLRAGHCEQVGSGRQVYERPASRFVADFIGEINWLTGTLVTSPADTARVRLPDGTEILAPATKVETVGVSVGIRPEKLRISAAASSPAANKVRATIREVVFQGMAAAIHLVTQWGAPLRAVRQLDQQDMDRGWVQGSIVDIEWDVEATLIFAKENHEIHQQRSRTCSSG